MQKRQGVVTNFESKVHVFVLLSNWCLGFRLYRRACSPSPQVYPDAEANAPLLKFRMFRHSQVLTRSSDVYKIGCHALWRFQFRRLKDLGRYALMPFWVKSACCSIVFVRGEGFVPTWRRPRHLRGSTGQCSSCQLQGRYRFALLHDRPWANMVDNPIIQGSRCVRARGCTRTRRSAIHRVAWPF